MPGANDSLILKEQAELQVAPFLFDSEDLPKIDKSKPKFHCTGERLFRDRLDVYKAVVRMLAEPGVTILEICRICHVTDNVVRSVKARENISIAHEKKTVLGSITHGLRLASERVIEVMPTASAKDALLGVGILTEKMQLLSGDVTERVAHVEDNICTKESWEAYLQSMMPADAHEVPSGMGLEAVKFPAKELTNGGSENGAQNEPEPAGDGAVVILKEAAV